MDEPSPLGFYSVALPSILLLAGMAFAAAASVAERCFGKRKRATHLYSP